MVSPLFLFRDGPAAVAFGVEVIRGLEVVGGAGILVLSIDGKDGVQSRVGVVVGGRLSVAVQDMAQVALLPAGGEGEQVEMNTSSSSPSVTLILHSDASREISGSN